MSTRPKKRLTVVHRLEDIPAFATEAEEHAFWASHELSEALWEQAELLEADELPTPTHEGPARIHQPRSASTASSKPPIRGNP